MKRTILAIVFLLAAGSAFGQSTDCYSMEAGLTPEQVPMGLKGVSICWRVDKHGHNFFTKVTLTNGHSGVEVITRAEFHKIDKEHSDAVRGAEAEQAAKTKREQREEDAKMCAQDPNWVANCKALTTK